MRYFGYTPIKKLVKSSIGYNSSQIIGSSNKDEIDSLLETAKGLGAIQFVEQYLK